MLLLLPVLVLCLVVSQHTGIECRNLSYTGLVYDNEICPSKTKTLHLLAVAPFPDTDYPELKLLKPGWVGGPAIIPASRLAVKHLNSRCDILEDYRLQLRVEDAGCNIDAKIQVSIAGILNRTDDTHAVGIIGPGCSAAAARIGDFLAHQEISLLHISPSATSPTLRNITRFPYTFRSVGTSASFIRVYSNLIESLQLTNITIFYEADRQVHTQAAIVLEDMARNMSVSVQSFGISSFSIPLSDIRNRLRVVFVFGSIELTTQLMCQAYHQGFRYPDYQFFIREILVGNFFTNVSFSLGGEDFECNEQQMKAAMEGHIISLFELLRPDNATILVNNMTFSEFDREYQQELRNYTQELEFSKVVETEYHGNYYDAVWALAIALNSSIPRLDSELGMSLSDYRYNRRQMTDIIRSELLEVDFAGVRGRISFSSAAQGGEEVTTIRVFQVKDANTELVTTFDPTLSSNGLNLTSDDAFIDGIFPKEIAATPYYVEIIIFLLVIVIMGITVFFHVINLRWNRVSTIRATSPALNNFIFLGCYLYMLSVICISFKGVLKDDHPVIFQLQCIGFTWCESVALTLIYGTICVKTWRLLRIFSHSSAKMITNLHTYRLALGIVGLVLIDVVINVIWNGADPWYMYSTYYDSEDPLLYHTECRCNNLYVWLVFLIGWKATMVVVVLYLAMASRQIPRKEYKHTKATNSLVYIFVIIYALLFPTYALFAGQTDVGLVTLSYLSLCFKNILCVLMCNIFIFLPPVLPHLQRRWMRCKCSNYLHKVCPCLLSRCHSMA